MLIDVGTDHGLVPIAAVQRDIAQRAIAADLRKAPLLLAQQNIAAAAVGQRVALLRADGLAGLARQAVDAVIMAGMSGEQMVRLCSASPHILQGVTQLLLQPNSDACVVRSWALAHGWHLRDERMVYERGQFFVLCAFRPGTGADPVYDVPGWSPSALGLVGPLLLVRRDPIGRRFFEWQCARLGALVDQQVHTLRPELAIWQAAYAFGAPG
jgi:tRNA (adenine22-N1)-methyltransferase